MSARLAVLNAVLRGIGRPLLRRTKTPERARRDFDLTARLFFRGPRRSAIETEIGGVGCLDVRPRGKEAGGLLLYLHGGGYITGSARSHLPMVGHLAARTGLRAVLPDYRLAPEHPFPAAFQDALSVWSELRAEEIDAERILLGGDSAGGGLALALLAHLLASGERPAGLFAFSPWTDLTLTGESLKENAERDPILPVERVDELRKMLAPEAELANPRLSPLFADFAGSPPIYMQASESEILRDDTIRLDARLRSLGVDVQTDLWPDTPHAWQLFRGWLPEADDALERAAAFADTCLKSSPRQSGN